MNTDQGKYTFGVLTLSDKGSRGEREDTSGAYIKEKLLTEGYQLQAYSIITIIFVRLLVKSQLM